MLKICFIFDQKDKNYLYADCKMRFANTSSVRTPYLKMEITMLKSIYALFVMVLFVAVPIAQAEGEKVKLKGAICSGTLHKVTCGYLGDVSIKEIYEKGWRVVSLIKDSSTGVSLIIEEQG